MKVRNLPYPFLRGQPLKFIRFGGGITDPYTGKCYFLISPKTCIYLRIWGGAWKGRWETVGTIRKALIYELLLASLCKRLLVHFYLLFESEFLSTCK